MASNHSQSTTDDHSGTQGEESRQQHFPDPPFAGTINNDTVIHNDDDDDNNLETETITTDAYGARLDQELLLVQAIQSTMTTLLRVLECARDDLVLLGGRMDRLRIASEKCRQELLKNKKNKVPKQAKIQK